MTMSAYNVTINKELFHRFVQEQLKNKVGRLTDVHAEVKQLGSMLTSVEVLDRRYEAVVSRKGHWTVLEDAADVLKKLRKQRQAAALKIAWLNDCSRETCGEPFSNIPPMGSDEFHGYSHDEWEQICEEFLRSIVDAK